MALGDETVVRLIVWEGKLKDGSMKQRQLKAYTNQLKDCINESVHITQWRYSRWKTYESETSEKAKLEVYIRHPKITEEQAKSDAIHELCGRLLGSNLAARLRLLNPGVSFTFRPSSEGRTGLIDHIFARCFSVAVVTQYCVGGTQSEEMERLKGDFLNRNNTKYLHKPMVALYSASDIAERYEELITQMLDGIEELKGVGEKMSSIRAAVQAARQTIAPGKKQEAGNPKSKPDTTPSIEKESGIDNSSKESKEVRELILANQELTKEGMRWAIAMAVWMTRAFIGYSPDLKKQLKPMLDQLNDVTIRTRLTLASQAYVDASSAPVAALNYLQGQAEATTDDIAMTINSFGSLMQSTMPLFDATLAISDAEFTTVAALSAAGGASLAGLSGGLGWLWYAGAATGPVGLCMAGAVSTIAFGTAAIFEGVKWGERQRTNPSNVLITIQKTMEECCRFLLGLAFMIAEEDEKIDKTHLQKIQNLRDQLSNQDWSKPGFMKGYYKLVSKKLAKDMEDLATGLRRNGAEIILSSG